MGGVRDRGRLVPSDLECALQRRRSLDGAKTTGGFGSRRSVVATLERGGVVLPGRDLRAPQGFTFVRRQFINKGLRFRERPNERTKKEKNGACL